MAFRLFYSLSQQLCDWFSSSTTIKTHQPCSDPPFLWFVTSVLFWKANIRFSIYYLAPRQLFWKVLLFVLCDSRIVITFIVTGFHRPAGCCVHTDRTENMSRAERLLPGLEHRPTSQLAPRTKPGISPFTQRYYTDAKLNPVKNEGETGSGSD